MSRTRTVAVVLFDGVNALDVTGPLEAFAAVHHDDGVPAYRSVIWTICGDRVRTQSALKLFTDAAAPENAAADLLMIPGGAGIREPRTLEKLAAWLRRNHKGFERIAAICTGAYALAEAGLLDGRTVTTHWAHAADLQRRYRNVTVKSDELFLQDGRFYSSGGVTAGIDLALDLIESDCGPGAAMEVARELVVFLRRTGTQAQFSEPLKMQTFATGKLADACLWAANNLSADLSVEALAARTHLSARQFTRRFRSDFGISPAAYIKNLRLDAARTALVESRSSIERIAHATGFQSADGFRRAFERRFRLSPVEYRKHFARRGRNP